MTSRRRCGSGGEKFRSFNIVLGMEMMHFLAEKTSPLFVVTVTWFLSFAIDATGEPSRMFSRPSRSATPSAMDWVPAQKITKAARPIFCARHLTSEESLVVSSVRIIFSDRQQAFVAPAIVDEPRRRLLRGLDAMHNTRPEIHHLSRLRSCTELAYILVESHLVILLFRRAW